MLAGGALNQENEKNAEMAIVCFGSRKLPKGLLRHNSPLRVGRGQPNCSSVNDCFGSAADARLVTELGPVTTM